MFRNVDESPHYGSISVPYYSTASRCGPFVFTAETLHMAFVFSGGDEQASGLLLVLRHVGICNGSDEGTPSSVE